MRARRSRLTTRLAAAIAAVAALGGSSLAGARPAGALGGPCIASLTSFLAGAQTYTLNVAYHTQAPTPFSNGFAFTSKHLPDANSASLGGTPGAGEPTIAVDALHGDRVYVSAPTGVPS